MDTVAILMLKQGPSSNTSVEADPNDGTGDPERVEPGEDATAADEMRLIHRRRTRLLKRLTPACRDALDAGKLTIAEAKAFAELPSETQDALIEHVVSGDGLAGPGIRVVTIAPRPGR